MDKKLVCPCGLTCCDCLFYKKDIYETAAKLKQLLADSKLDVFLTLCSNERTINAMSAHLGSDNAAAHSKLSDRLGLFKDMPAFMNILDGLIKTQCKTTCCEAGGCSTGGETVKCKALQCLESKQYNGCWQCDEFEDCENLQFLRMSYGHVINENLNIIKEKGTEEVPSRGTQYYAWQRKLP